jgi:hypothetical protein
MSEGARLESVELLRSFRAVLLKFCEEAGSALMSADSDIHRAALWLETEQASWWKLQLRKRAEAVEKAREAVRAKKLFKDSAGRQPSAVDEEKALKLAQRALEEAEAKAENCRRWKRELVRETDLYRGQVQRFATTVQADLPEAARRLGRMLEKLEEYLAAGAVSGVSTPGRSAFTSAARAIDEAADIADDAEVPRESGGD